MDHSHRIRAVLGLAALVLFVPLAACTAPSPPEPDTEETLPEVAPPLTIDELPPYTGVVRLNAGSNCTGTLVETDADTAPAYVITNGHCVGDVGRAAQETTVDLDWFGTADFFAVQGNEESELVVDVAAIEYSTMHTTDMAVLRLDATLGELREQGVLPLRIIGAEPQPGAAVVNVGVPVQGLHPDAWVLRKGECALSEQGDLIEFRWLWFDVWSNDCPGVIQGSSGSPLIADGEIAAVINTTTAGIAEAVGGACWLNRPCEVVDGTPTMRLDTSYAQSVAGIGACFSDAGFALGGECPLTVTEVWAETGGGAYRGGDEPDPNGGLPSAALAGRAAGDVMTAVVPLGDPRACRATETYLGAPAVSVPAADTIEWDGPQPAVVAVDLPQEEGFWMLCVAAPGAESVGSAVLFEVDRTPPVIAAGASVEDIGDGAMVVWPHLDPPELSTVRFTWGAPDAVNCENVDAFQDFFTQPLMLSADDLPASYCVIGLDSAGNATPVTRIEID